MKERILLADGDEPVRKMLARVLESAGYSVVHASTASEAVSKFRFAQPDLVLLEIKSPKDEGWTACQTLIRDARPVPLIVITSWPNQSEHALEQGVNVLMEKPLDMTLLLKKIEALLNRQNACLATAAQ